MQGLSIREFAKLDGCTSTLVKRGKDRGTIRAFDDGSLDPAFVGTGWRQGNRRGAQPAAECAQPDAPPVHSERHGQGSAFSVDGEAAEAARAALEALEAPDGLFASFADADRARVSWIAHHRHLEYERERGKLIEIDRVVQAIEEDFGQVRTTLVAAPAAWAPQLHRCKTVVELQDLFMRLVVEALEALSSGRAAKYLG